LREEHALALQAKEREVLQSLAVGYAKDLRDKRMDAYRLLWNKLEVLALYQPKADLTYSELETLAAELREWYFSSGGLLLSTASRNAYFACQDALVEVLRAVDAASMTQAVRPRHARITRDELDAQEHSSEAWRPAADPAADYVQIRQRTSALRSALCDDLGTRARPLVSES
jgi:hypothetical protein